MAGVERRLVASHHIVMGLVSPDQRGRLERRLAGVIRKLRRAVAV